MPLRGHKIFPITQSVVAVYLMAQGGLLVAVAMWFLKQRRVRLIIDSVQVLERRPTGEVRVRYVLKGWWKETQWVYEARENWYTSNEDPLYPVSGQFRICYVPWYPFVEVAPTFVEEAPSLEGLAYAFGVASLVAGALTLLTAWLGHPKRPKEFLANTPNGPALVTPVGGDVGAPPLRSVQSV